ncbi:Tab2/Atab2 family RNA-binding protein [Prochlorococcus marinus]|uniref:Tab2/Atab2 family RNA-binding protein n=1 Tax=Prochlorococcus marinus TaxID=1219 RepID=UPI0022B3743B|nr:Tab2/Atab2 family RNA-binding protein [Prochlorococcus marinus]
MIATKKSDLKNTDWELDFYSRPIIDENGKKRWELLITSTNNFKDTKTFKWEKTCPANSVNSIWLKNALEEAIDEACSQGWEKPSVIRCWRSSMKTMIKRAADQIGIELISSRRTYSLLEWINDREKSFYPKQKGYIGVNLAPPSSPIANQAIPLPEEVRGDSWSFASLSLNTLREADEWEIQFSNLIPIKDSIDQHISIPGIRLFSPKRSLALAAWLGGLEPAKLLIEGTQIILEAGQSDRWLVTDVDKEAKEAIENNFINTKIEADGLQFISVQKSPEENSLDGFWMLKDIGEI